MVQEVEWKQILMMKTKKILIELIDFLDEFEREREEVGVEMNMTDFLGFLNSKYKTENVKTRPILALIGKHKISICIGGGFGQNATLYR